MKKRILSWVIVITFGIALACAISLSRGLDSSIAFSDNCRHLSDGCFVAGLLMTGVGALAWISTTGFFDIFGYGVRSILVLFTPFKKPENQETYIEYKAKRQAQRKQPVYSILVTGVCLVLLSVLFLYLYYSA